MFKKATKEQVIPSIFIFLWIFIVNLVTPMITSAPAWPMFFVTIFFFIMGGDVKHIPMIFCSGAVGILFAFILGNLLAVMAPVMGEAAAVVILLFAVLFLIIVIGNFLPLFLNNITFAYLTVCAIVLDPQVIQDSFLGWILMHLVGGAIILGGALLIFTVAGKIAAKKQPQLQD